MAELTVPEIVEDPFREHYRQLIVAAVQHAAPEPVARSRGFGRELRSAIRLVWLAAVALLVVDLVAFGVDSWTTSVADLGVIVLTLAWFWLCAEDLVHGRESEPEQLELFT